MATRIIDDAKLQNIAVAIQGKDGGGQMTVDEMPDRIDVLNVTDKWELLNEVILDEDVSIIKININAYENDYSAFLVAPQLTPSNYPEWLYIGRESEERKYIKGLYSFYSLDKGAFEYPKYFGYYSPDLSMLISNNAVGSLSTPIAPTDIQSIVLSLYYSRNTFLSGGSYKLYGKKTEDYLIAN